MKKNYVKPDSTTFEMESDPILLDGSNFLPNGSDEDAGAGLRLDEVPDFTEISNFNF